MIDTHCHLFCEYYDDLDKTIADIKASGVEKVIINGCDIKSNLEVLKLIKKYDIAYGAIGFHPTELNDDINLSLKFLEEHVNDNKIVAIGEIGLDYYYDSTDKQKQIYIFKKQLEIASKFKKPIIVHSRDAIKDTYDIISEYNVSGSVHAFSGSLEMALKFIKRGFYIGIGGICTYNNAVNIVNVIKSIDLSYILLETDSPYLSPVPYRGQTNTPAYIPLIAQKVSEIKHVPFDVVLKTTTDNATSLFDF